MKASARQKHDTRWVFIKKGTCSRTFFYILNREFGHPMEEEECAADPLAGGIFQQGYQCGQLWGASLAAGAEAYRRWGGVEEATAPTIRATQQLLESFERRAGSPDCEDIVQADLTKKNMPLKLLVQGKFMKCFRLANKWAPEAIRVVQDGLSATGSAIPETASSCAAEVIRKMGGTEQQMTLVAGFAGGMGLSGNACGALAAAIWFNTLDWVRKNPGKTSMMNPGAEKTLQAFFEAGDYEFQCSALAGRTFDSIEEHSEFIKCGGCLALMDKLAATASNIATTA